MSEYLEKIPDYRGMFESDDGTVWTLKDYGLCRGRNPWEHMITLDGFQGYALRVMDRVVKSPASMADLLRVEPETPMSINGRREYVRDLIALGMLVRRRDPADRRRILYHAAPDDSPVLLNLRKYYAYVPANERAGLIAEAVSNPGTVPGRMKYHANRARKAARADRRRARLAVTR